MSKIPYRHFWYVGDVNPILAIVTGCNSYRGIVTFIDVHRHKLNVSGAGNPRISGAEWF